MLSYTATTLYLIAGALLNRLRGWGIFPKDKVLTTRERIIKALKSKVVAVPFYFGTATWIYSDSITAGVIVMLGYQLWALPGWGEYWDASEKENHEVAFIDFIFKDIKNGFLKDFLSLSVRGLIGWPTFLMLYLFQDDVSWHALLIGVGLFLQGAIYHAWRLINDGVDWVRRAEFTMGALWAGLIALAL